MLDFNFYLYCASRDLSLLYVKILLWLCKSSKLDTFLGGRGGVGGDSCDMVCCRE